MIRIVRRLLPAVIAAGVMLLAAGLPQAAPERPASTGEAAQLAAVRQQCIAAAQTVQQKERSLAALDMAIGVLQRAAAAQQEQLDQHRAAEEQLLGALARLARAPPEELAFAPEGPIERVRSGILIGAAVPALQAEAKSLSGQLSSFARLRDQLNVRRPEFDAARGALTQARDALASLVAKRTDLIAELLPNDGKIQGVAQLGDQATDLFDLIKRADAATDQHDKDRLVALRVALPARVKAPLPVIDSTRPPELRALDAPRASMLWPVSGELVHRFGEADKFGRPTQGIALKAEPFAVVVAPFDGRVDFVGSFRPFGLILIIRHPGGYHSLLAGLGQVNVTAGQWLLAGEPVGSMPGADDKSVSTGFYLELRRDGRPVDPQSRLVSRDDKTEDNPGTKVTE